LPQRVFEKISAAVLENLLVMSMVNRATSASGHDRHRKSRGVPDHYEHFTSTPHCSHRYVAAAPVSTSSKS
jgi:hypothetical protein